MSSASTENQNNRENLLARLVEWSSERPLWQQDALRRLVQKGHLTDSDLDDLTAICKSKHVARSGDTSNPRPIPLKELGLPETARSLGAVTLTRISCVSGVNALPTGARLDFVSVGAVDAAGLVVVYGANASGKSGFARILRSACRSRSRDLGVLPNVLDDSDVKQTATISYRCGSDPGDFSWTPDSTPDPKLKTVSVFDADYAEAQLSGPNAVSFLPPEIDLLERLARGGCREVSRRLETEIEAIARQLTLQHPEINALTEAGRQVHSLSSESDFETIKKLARLSPEDKKRQQDLRHHLASKPAEEAKQALARSERFRRFSEELRILERLVSRIHLQEIRSAHKRLLATQEAARIAAKKSFSTEPLEGVGSETWRQLWEAAKRFSQQTAYPNQDYPVTEPDATCVLCQQPLGVEAQKRLRRFEAFVSDETAQAAELAKREFKQYIDRFPESRVQAKDHQLVMRDLRDADPAVAAIARCILRIARRTRRLLFRSESSHVLRLQVVTSIPPASSTVALVAQREQARAAELQGLAQSRQRQVLEEELEELAAREDLSRLLPRIETEIALLRQTASLKKCQTDVDTTAITRESIKMAEELVSSV